MDSKFAEFLNDSIIGGNCEVRTTENALLYMGTVTKYAEEAGQIQVSVRGDETTPMGVVHNTQVKIKLHAGKGQRYVLVVYATVDRGTDSFWWLQLTDLVSCEERRENFRQPVNASAVVVNEEEDEDICELVDISLTGLCFRSRRSYEVEEELVVKNVRLLRDGMEYKFDCTVRRTSTSEDMPGKTAYGCSFEELRPRVEDQLLRDIFTLQAGEIHKARQR